MSIPTETGSAIADRLRALVGADQVDTDPDELRAASVDRFKKYQTVHGIYDGPFPCAIVYATSTDDVARVLAFADAEGLNVVPRTGRTGTEGGLETTVPDTVVLDGSRMAAILAVDEEDMQATVQCGVPLQVLEDRLREQGLTTGHSPQSRPLAQLGGLVATRSIGQLSTLYGGIEDLVVGLEAVLPDGTVTRIKNVPRRAAGPDVRHLVIGNEGALCFVTEVTVKVFRHRPENQRFHGYLVDDVRTGVAVLREVVAEGYRPSVARLYSPDDATQHFAEVSQGRWLLVFVAEGPRAGRRGHQRGHRGRGRRARRTASSTRRSSRRGSRGSTGARTRSTRSGPRCSPPRGSATPPRCRAAGRRWPSSTSR